MLTILCFSAIIIAGTELHQLLKLPVLVQHFHEHQQEDKSISLVKFIIIHYFSGSPKDKDYDRDMQLPFKTADCTSLISLIPAAPHFITAQPDFFIKRTFPTVKNNWFCISRMSDIWQPPRQA